MVEKRAAGVRSTSQNPTLERPGGASLLGNGVGPGTAHGPVMAPVRHVMEFVCWQLADESKLAVYRI
jgi:hypothetical protein